MISIDIDQFIRIIRKNHKNLNAPVISFIGAKGSTPFEILISTLLSLRTKDEVTLGATLRLFDHARTPRELLALPKESIEKLIYPVGFYHTKADRLLAISRIILEQYDGNVPDDMDKLLALPGVGRKTANLVLAEGFGQPAVCVDTHVHRISNRIGFVDTRTPEKTEFALREKLPGNTGSTIMRCWWLWVRPFADPFLPFAAVARHPGSALKSGLTVRDKRSVEKTWRPKPLN